MELSWTSHEAAKLLYSGNCYMLHKTVNDTKYWCCEQQNCNGYLTSNVNCMRMINVPSINGHPLDAACIIAVKIVATIK